MKNQYVCDIGDYGKYSLLRYIARDNVSIGVNWYLTNNDTTNDGKYKEYLSRDNLSQYDFEVFECLRTIYNSGNRVTVLDIQKSNVIPNAVFYSKNVDFCGTPSERKKLRSEWFERSIKAFKDVRLIFMDPDNGLLTRGDGAKRGVEKYILPEEVFRYYNEGHDVVYYCQRGRRSKDKWVEYLQTISKDIPDAGSIVITYHKGTQRSYVFIVHESNYDHLDALLSAFSMFHWNNLFSVDYKKRPVESLSKTKPVQDKDTFIIYNEENVILEGDIKNGCLHLESCVYGEDYDSEKHYTFTKEDTAQLFSVLSYDEFLASCRSGHLLWLEDFLESNGIHPSIACF